ncbi:MAG: PaaI family thioesterase [Xanthobacteraceae bacterium]
MTAFDKATATRHLAEMFAPWVQDLDLSVEAITADGVDLRMRFSERLCREGGVICGQAMMSLADTAMPLAISAVAGEFLPMTTVDQTMHFLRPAAQTDLVAEARVIRLGRTMAYGSIAIRPATGDNRPVAMAQTAYALLRDKK